MRKIIALVGLGVSFLALAQAAQAWPFKNKNPHQDVAAPGATEESAPVTTSVGTSVRPARAISELSPKALNALEVFIDLLKEEDNPNPVDLRTVGCCYWSERDKKINCYLINPGDKCKEGESPVNAPDR